MTSRQRKKDRTSRFVGSWQESLFDKTELPFTVENLKFLLTEGEKPKSTYTHQQIADWCIRFWLEFDELRENENDLLYQAIEIALDVDAQWDLYLTNEFTFNELSEMDFSKVELPTEWFSQWLKELETLKISSQHKNEFEI